MKIKFPVTKEMAYQLKKSGIRHRRHVRVEEASYKHFTERLTAAHPDHNPQSIQALAVLCCLTHPDHKGKHKTQLWWWILAALAFLSLLLFGEKAFAQTGTSQIDVITFQNAAGATIKTFAAPFRIKCSTNVTCAAAGSTLTITASGGAGGGGYATIQNGGVPIAQEPILNFLGALACVDDAINTRSNCQLTANIAVANQYISGIDANGNFTRAVIPVTSVFTRSGAIVAASGDYAAAQVTNAFDITVANTLTNVVAPAAPAAGFVKVFSDSTNLVLSSKNSAGTVSNTVVPSTCTNQVASAISASGVITCHTVVSADTSGNFAATPHNLLSGTHGDTTAASPVRGDGLFAIGGTAWQRLAHPATTGGYFKWNGTDIVASTLAAAGTGSCTNQFERGDNADAAPTCAAVNRASEAADGRGWAFCGSATGATTTVGPVSASTCCSGGLCQQFHVIILIKGYNGGTPIGRLLVANGTISTTARTNGNSESEDLVAKSTQIGAAAIPGLPLATTLSAIGRYVVCDIDGASGSLKTIYCNGVEGTPAVATAPVFYRGASFFSDLGTNLALANFQLSVYDTQTATAVSAQTFTAGTYIMVLGRNTD